jgi:hypothetical protein
MTHKRYDLSNAKIEEELAKANGDVNTVCKRLNCSYRLVHDVKMGRRKDIGPKPIPKNPLPPAEDPCTCCGFRPKAPGNRYLCEDCFRNEGEAFDEAPLNCGISKSVTLQHYI